MLAVVAGSDVLTRLKLVGGLISFVGVGIVIAAGPGLGVLGGAAATSGASDLLALGYGLTLAAAVCWSIYTAWAAPHLHQHSPLRTTAWAMVGGSLVLLPFGLWEGIGANWAAVDIAAWGGLLYSALEVPMLLLPLVAWCGRSRAG